MWCSTTGLRSWWRCGGDPKDGESTVVAAVAAALASAAMRRACAGSGGDLAAGTTELPGGSTSAS
jgi:hypothetical protein